MNLVKLESVGSVFNIEDNQVYPQMENGNPDLEMGTSLEEVSDEWWAGLSAEDAKFLELINL